MNPDDLELSMRTGAHVLDDMGAPSGIDRNKFMTASEATSCIRKQYYSKHPDDYEPAPQSWGYARRGRYAETYVLDALRMANVPIALTGDNQKSIGLKEYGISATPDGIIVPDHKSAYAAEIKSFDPRMKLENMKKPAHVAQLQIGMEVLIKSGEVSIIDHGLLLYVNASDYDDIHAFKVERDVGILGRLKPRAQKLLRARSPDNLDREGGLTGECKLCPYRGPCGVKETDNTGDRKRANRGSNLDDMAMAYVVRKKTIEDNTAGLKELAEGIKQELLKRKKTKLVVGSIEIELQAVKGRASFDKKAAEADGVDLSPYTKTGVPSERLNVRQKET